MNNKKSKQISNKAVFEDLDLTVDKENSLAVNLQNLQNGHDLEVKKLIAKNKKLLAIIAHDIRSPMSLIVGFLGLLRDSIDTLERNEIETKLEIALDSAKKTFTILDNLLNWAINEHSVNDIRQEYADIATLVREEIDAVKSFAIQKQITIYADAIPSIDVFIDIDMIKSVFRNLLQNAIKNTFLKGEIRIYIAKQEEHIEVTIEDNGIGIKEEIRKMIFSPKKTDMQLNASKESRIGFGLILCKEIVDFHRGEIWVLSDRGKGSKFKFTLPLHPQ